MISNMELYGTNDVPRVPAAICNERLELLETRLEALTSVHFMYHNNNLINRVLKAKRHWTKLRDGETV